MPRFRIPALPSLLLAAVSLGGCGQMGPLTLPETAADTGAVAAESAGAAAAADAAEAADAGAADAADAGGGVTAGDRDDEDANER